MSDGNTPQTAPAQPTTNPQSMTGLVDVAETNKKTFASWVDADEASGRMTKEQAAQARREIGVGETPVDPRSAEQKTLDAQNGPPAQPHEYNLTGLFHGVPEQEAVTSAKLVGSWLSTAGFDRDRGTSAAKIADRVARQLEGKTEAERELHRRSSMLALERQYGAALKEKLNLAREFVRMVDRKSPGLLAYLDETGVGNDPLFVSLIVSQAERYAARNGKR